MQDPLHGPTMLSFKDVGSDLVHPMFQLREHEEHLVCLRSAASKPKPDATGLDEPSPEVPATRFYLTSLHLRQYSHVFSDILAVSNEKQPVLQLAEDASTLAHLLQSTQADLNDYPDLLELDLAGLNELYKAAFRYGIVPVQNLVEHCIRLRMQITILRTPTFHERLADILVTAWTFNRLVLFRETAAIVANMRKSLRERVTEAISADIGPKGVTVFMAELAKVEREKRQQIWSGITISTETVEVFDEPSDGERDTRRVDVDADSE